MGAKVTTTAITGYNASPPPDGGEQTAANLVTWAKSKEKLADPVKTAFESLNTKLVAYTDFAVRRITTSDSLVAGDHMRTVEIGPSVSTVVTVTLADAATMTNVYRVYIKNSGTKECTIARTGSDTIDGVAANISIPSGSSFLLTTNNAANGYLIAGVYPLEITNITEESAPAVSDTVALYDLSATALRKATLQNLLKIINGLSEDTAPDLAADFVATYDASGTAAKKVLLGRLGAGVLGTEQASTSGTSIDFTSIPSWAKKIIIQFVGVSTSGTGDYWVQLGDAGGVETTGYACAVSALTTAVSTANATSAFAVAGPNSAAAVVHGQLVLTLEDAAGFTWVASSVLAQSNTAQTHVMAGSKALSAALDRVRITTSNGTDTFDAGAVNILYE